MFERETTQDQIPRVGLRQALLELNFHRVQRCELLHPARRAEEIDDGIGAIWNQRHDIDVFGSRYADADQGQLRTI